MTEIEIYSMCLALGMTPAGAAGCTANILAESAGRPNNVEDRSGIADETYTRNVDNGSYRNFSTDAYGYGFCQWTSRDRKSALLDYAQGKGVSIGDANMQMQFMGREMRASYSFVWNRLCSSDDPYDCGYVMCKFFEIPANTESQSQYRGTQARQIYQRCAGTAPANDPVDEPTAERFWPPRTLCINMNGADVYVLQALLVAHGYSVTTISGVFGISTDKAVRQYQADNDLVVDGIAGPKTFAKLTKL